MRLVSLILIRLEIRIGRFFQGQRSNDVTIFLPQGLQAATMQANGGTRAGRVLPPPTLPNRLRRSLVRRVFRYDDSQDRACPASRWVRLNVTVFPVPRLDLALRRRRINMTRRRSIVIRRFSILGPHLVSFMFFRSNSNYFLVQLSQRVRYRIPELVRR